jgi:hypothetical protein
LKSKCSFSESSDTDNDREDNNLYGLVDVGIPQIPKHFMRANATDSQSRSLVTENIHNGKSSRISSKSSEIGSGLAIQQHYQIRNDQRLKAIRE